MNTRDVVELSDGGDELAHAAMDAATALLGGEGREAVLDEVHPRGKGRSVVDLEVGMALEPAADEGALVGAGVVADDVDLKISSGTPRSISLRTSRSGAAGGRRRAKCD